MTEEIMTIRSEINGLQDSATEIERMLDAIGKDGNNLMAKVAWLERENEKLRELMRDTYDCICEMYRYVDGGYAYEDAEADPAYGPILKRMRDLGIEVR